MKMWIKSGGLLLLLLMAMQWAVGAPFVREASFQRIFDGTNFFEEGKHLPINLSVMSSDGEVVAFYGTDTFDGNEPHLFIHNFDSTGFATEVNLPAQVYLLDTFAGMTSNADGSRIFFVARDRNTGDDLFCMLNGKSGAVSILLDTNGTSIENPNDIGTDGVGSYLYFNESDTGLKNEGDLWRISADGSGPELVIPAAAVKHPTEGFGRFVGEFDVSDYGNTIAFFLDGWQTDSDKSTTDKELFVLTGGKGGTIKNLTHDFQNGKSDVRLSGNGTTIVYTGRDVNGEVSPTGSSDWMVTKSSSNLNEQHYIEPGYHSGGYRPGITTDGSVIFGTSNPNTVSNLHGYLIRSDGSGRLHMDTYSATSGIRVQGTSEGIHLSADGTRVFFKQRGTYGGFNTTVSHLYTGIFNFSPWTWLPNPPWATEVPVVTGIKYPAPLAFGITDPEDFPPFKVTISVSDPQGVADTDTVAKQMLRYNGYPDDGGYGPVKVDTIYSTDELSPGLWETDGYRGYQWPVPPEDPSYADYYDDPLEIEFARFSVKDLDGNVAYRDIILQAAEGGCSGTGPQELNPDDLAEGKDVSCITDGIIETRGEVTVRDGVVLYLSGYGIYLNGGSTDSFKVQAGAGLIIR